MWYKKAKPLIEAGNIVMLGVVQEQHAERARLYKQWKQFDFPILQDATTLLNLQAVPIPLLLDEQGVVRDLNPRVGNLEKFVEMTFESPGDNESANAESNSKDKYKPAASLLFSGDASDTNKAIDAFNKLVETNDKDGQALFGLGVAYRTRFDSSHRQPGDFKKASAYWSRALATNPNQYIWRRRIEQYGPRLSKPYPFYDWVETAIDEIKQRGEKPIELTVTLTGSEIAKRPKRNEQLAEPVQNPDPEAKIFADEGGYLTVKPVQVPAVVIPGNNVRVHLQLELSKKAKWNSEAGPIKVWIEKSEHGSPTKQLLEVAGSTTGDKNSLKTLDFEYKTNQAASRDQIHAKGYVLFHCCDDEGVCYYLRKDFQFPIRSK